MSESLPSNRTAIFKENLNSRHVVKIPLKQKKRDRSRTQGDLSYSQPHNCTSLSGLVLRKIKLQNDSMYEGYMNGSCRHGHGKLHDSSGIYIGMWANDMQEGQGKKVFLTGDRHEGEYASGKRSGPGTYLWANGDKYIGHWFEGKMNGYGSFSWACGDIYKGEWRNGKTHGRGKKSFHNGDDS